MYCILSVVENVDLKNPHIPGGKNLRQKYLPVKYLYRYLVITVYTPV